jgi:hypothetical protein
MMSTEGAIPGPAYWSAEDTAVWTRDATSPFGPDLPFPAHDLARRGTVLLEATSGPDGGGLPPGLIPTTGGSSGVWRSADSGRNWQRLDTPGPPWSGVEPARFDRVAWTGPTPVVAGTVDGRLAVWTGTFHS